MAATTKSKIHRYYVRETLIPFEEDMMHEFKGHRNISVEELPPWTQESRTERASRRAVSRALNAFLNTGKGGTAYLGVVDSGIVRGLKLTPYQMDHLVGSLDDLMSRYSPPVKQHRYKVRFVPVVEFNATEEEIHIQCSKNASYANDEERKRPHKFRSYVYCWCDKDAVAQYNCGVLPSDYVVEITIKAWDPSDPKNKEDGCGTLMCHHPYHTDEEGCVYFRRQASLVKYTMTEMAMLTRQEIRESCEEEIRRLKQEIMNKKASRMKSKDDG